MFGYFSQIFKNLKTLQPFEYSASIFLLPEPTKKKLGTVKFGATSETASSFHVKETN